MYVSPNWGRNTAHLQWTNPSIAIYQVSWTVSFLFQLGRNQYHFGTHSRTRGAQKRYQGGYLLIWEEYRSYWAHQMSFVSYRIFHLPRYWKKGLSCPKNADFSCFQWSFWSKQLLFPWIHIYSRSFDCKLPLPRSNHLKAWLYSVIEIGRVSDYSQLRSAFFQYPYTSKKRMLRWSF